MATWKKLTEPKPGKSSTNSKTSKFVKRNKEDLLPSSTDGNLLNVDEKLSYNVSYSRTPVNLAESDDESINTTLEDCLDEEELPEIFDKFSSTTETTTYSSFEEDRHPGPQIKKFDLKFTNQTRLTPFLRIRQPHPLQLSTTPITKTFHIFARRRNYTTYPIRWIGNDDQPLCPFIITSAGTVTYKLVSDPKSSAVQHLGASVTIDNAKQILISFLMVSTYLTKQDKDQLHIKMHTGKQWELVCFDPSDNTILGTVGFQVVCEPRNSLKRPLHPNLIPQVSTSTTLDSFDSDSSVDPLDGDDNAPRLANIKKLQKLIPHLTSKNLKLLIRIAEVMTEQ